MLLTVGLLLQLAADAPTPPHACAQAMALGPSAAASELCAAEADEQAGGAANVGTQERRSQLTSAARRYERAIPQLGDDRVRLAALVQLAAVYDKGGLDLPEPLERTLRAWIALDPSSLQPVLRLARVEEDTGRPDAAEQTLLDARRSRPESVDTFKALAQFYARRVTALTQASVAAENDRKPRAQSGEKDENGVYRVGNGIDPPKRLDQPLYPPDALAAGIQGGVAIEIVVSEAGQVVDARVVRSIPLLDDAALKAVREWRFHPTVVNGQPVPVRSTVTVNFTTR